MNPELPAIVEHRRLASPARAPQALAWHQGALWVSSRDDRRMYGIKPETWTVFEEAAVPHILWGAASDGENLRVVSGEGEDDDRYLRRYVPGVGLDGTSRVALPELTGSYLSCNGGNLYVSQWYKQRLLQLGAEGKVLRGIAVGAEISGHTFADGRLYVLRGTEKDGETWHLARLDVTQETATAVDLARVPFACRSLAFDGTAFWTNHRAQNETVCFSLPEP